MALPTLIDPRKLANQGIVLEGQFHDQHLPRLGAAVASIESPLSALVKFEVDEARAKVASGTLSITVSAVCQRCLDPVTIALSSDFAAQVIWSEEQLTNVPSNREPWIVVDKMASLNELLEDEILLALPLGKLPRTWSVYRRHLSFRGRAQGYNEKEDEIVGDNPFNILQQLKK